MDLQSVLKSAGVDIPNNYSIQDGELVFENGIRITKHYHLMEKGQVKPLGMAITVNEDLSSVHPDLIGTSRAIFPSRDTTKIFNFGSEQRGPAEILYRTPDNEPSSITKYLNGIQLGEVDYSESAMKTIQSAVSINKIFNLQIINNNNNSNNNTTIINCAKHGRVSALSVLRSLDKHVLDAFKYNGSKLYQWDGYTWNIIKVSSAALWLQNEAEKMVSSFEMKTYLDAERSREFANSLKRLAYDNHFHPSLNPQHFPLYGQILEHGQLRPSTKEDHVFFHVGWKYDTDNAIKYRADLEDFIKKLFPDATERRLMLKFCASLLHGKRAEKKYIVLTDERGGDNGKTAWTNFLLGFFGELCENNTKLFLSQSISDKNGQDEIKYTIMNKRLLIGSEFKSTYSLDEGFLKALTGSEQIKGRRFGRSEYFSCFPQAGVILVYNEGDAPKEDFGDASLNSRKVVFPMRSKFSHEQESDDWSTFTFKAKELDDMHLFYSAFLDLLIPLISINWTKGETFTDNMLRGNEIGSEICSEIVDAIEDRVEYTGNAKDFIQLKLLFDACRFPKRITFKMFKLQAILYFKRKRGVYKKTYQPLKNGRQLHLRNIILNFQMK